MPRLHSLSMAVLIDRLVLRKYFYLAIRICQYLKLPESEGASRILAHWACYKVSLVMSLSIGLLGSFYCYNKDYLDDFCAF